MTIAQRIVAEGKIIGNKALFSGTIYELRGNGEWRRVKDQKRAFVAFCRAEREADREARRQRNAAVLDRHLAAQVDASFEVTATPLTQERQKPSHLSVTRSPAALADFLLAVERRRRHAS